MSIENRVKRLEAKGSGLIVEMLELAFWADEGRAIPSKSVEHSTDALGPCKKITVANREGSLVVEREPNEDNLSFLNRADSEGRAWLATQLAPHGIALAWRTRQIL